MTHYSQHAYGVEYGESVTRLRWRSTASVSPAGSRRTGAETLLSHLIAAAMRCQRDEVTYRLARVRLRSVSSASTCRFAWRQGPVTFSMDQELRTGGIYAFEKG